MAVEVMVLPEEPDVCILTFWEEIHASSHITEAQEGLKRDWVWMIKSTRH